MERKLIAAAVSSALALPMAAQAVEFSVSGHINRAVVSVDGRREMTAISCMWTPIRPKRVSASPVARSWRTWPDRWVSNLELGENRAHGVQAACERLPLQRRR